jgi:hypothetical protein
VNQKTAPLKSGEWSVGCCGGRFTGLRTAHCTVCHQTWTSPAGFDRHRRYGKCLTPDTMRDKAGYLIWHNVFQDAGRAYPCWSFTGDGRFTEDDE